MEQFVAILSADKWPWYIAGPIIGLCVPLLLLLVEKPLGISSSLRHICAISMPKSKVEYFRKDNWRGEFWNIVFVLGLILGGGISSTLLSGEDTSLLPPLYYTLKGSVIVFIGGILVGFGTRYADGCTSGHSIFGLSNLQWVSLKATLAFFAGGLFMAGLKMFLPG